MLIFFFTLDPRLFLFFWGVLDMENTVRQLKKSKRSILFDADAIFKAVTAHAQILKNIFYLNELPHLYTSNYTSTTLLTTSLDHFISHTV